jgi:hypothetical protein
MNEELDLSELVEAMDRLRRIYQQSRPTRLSASPEHIDRPERQTRSAGEASLSLDPNQVSTTRQR